MPRAIEAQRLCLSPYSFCMDAAERYFHNVATHLRLAASPFGASAFPGIWWGCNLIAMPMRKWLRHGRVPHEFALCLEPRSDGVYPTVRGALRLEPLMPGSQLDFVGSYELPDSLLGSVLDGFVPARLVRESIETFLDELVRSMELQFEQFCAGVEMSHATAHIANRVAS